MSFEFRLIWLQPEDAIQYIICNKIFSSVLNGEIQNLHVVNKKIKRTNIFVLFLLHQTENTSSQLITEERGYWIL